MTFQQQTLFTAAEVPDTPTAPETPAAMPQASANADPVTSHEAEAVITASGQRQKHAEIVLAIVRRRPSSTGHEIFAAATRPEKKALGTYHEVYRRLSDLRHAGQIKQGEPRKCRIKQSRMVVWELRGE